MSWKDEMDAAIVKWLQTNVHTEANEFVGFGEAREVTYSSGCNTCDYGYEGGFELELTYTVPSPVLDWHSEFRTYTYEGELGDFIRALTD